MAIKQENYGIVSWFLIVGSTLVVGLAPGYLGLTRAGDWYDGLSKPALTPDPAVFPIVWPVLFLLMGSAAWRVHRAADASIKERREAIELYAVQLLVNVAWPVLFFHFQLVGVAAATVAVLVILVIMTQGRFWKIRRSAGLLFLPYLLWTLFAAYLTLSILIGG